MRPDVRRCRLCRRNLGNTAQNQFSLWSQVIDDQWKNRRPVEELLDRQDIDDQWKNRKCVTFDRMGNRAGDYGGHGAALEKMFAHTGLDGNSTIHWWDRNALSPLRWDHEVWNHDVHPLSDFINRTFDELHSPAGIRNNGGTVAVHIWSNVLVKSDRERCELQKIGRCDGGVSNCYDQSLMGKLRSKHCPLIHAEFRKTCDRD